MNNPLISIIIPVYNAEKYLRQCLDSVLSQTYTNWECLLVDDGSKDSSGTICDEYAHRNPRFKVFHKENGGVSSARNYGIKEAQGKWISFVDSDDMVSSEYLQALKHIITPADLVVFGCKKIYEDGTNMTKCFPMLIANTKKEVERVLLLVKRPMMPASDLYSVPWSKFYKSEIIKHNDIQFPTDIAFREDEIFNSRYCKYISSIKVVPDSLYVYRIANSGLANRTRSAFQYYRLSHYIKENIINLSNDEFIAFDTKRAAKYLLHALRGNISFKERIAWINELKQYKRLLISGRKFKILLNMPTIILAILLHIKSNIRHIELSNLDI